MEWYDEFKQLRKGLGLSREALAARLHVTLRTIARWEDGEVRKEKALELERMREWAVAAKRQRPARKR